MRTKTWNWKYQGTWVSQRGYPKGEKDTFIHLSLD